MPHALAAHRGGSDLHAARLTDETTCALTPVLAAGARPVCGRPEDAFTKQPRRLRLIRQVVDRLRQHHLTRTPRTDLRRRGDTETQGGNRLVFQHDPSFLTNCGMCCSALA